MNNKFKGSWLAAAAVALTISPAMAWGPLGHKTVALIAQHRLSAGTLAKVQAIIGKDVGLDQISNCADVMLHVTDSFACGSFMVPADPSKKTGHWHYVNIPIAAPLPVNPMDYCPHGDNCVVAQIRKQIAVLQSPAASIGDKRMALMFLVHFVADEHQPLHAADDDDYGGGKKTVDFKGSQKSLHALWDDLIRTRDWRRQQKASPTSLVKELEKDINRKDTADWTRGDFINDAAVESFTIAKNVIYPQYARDKGRDLGDAYQKQMRPIVKERLEKAGVRLAAILTEIFGP